MQQQPLLHQSTLSPKGKEQAVEEESPQTGSSASAPAANGNEAGSSSETHGDKGEKWNAVAAAEINVPVGIITIEDVLEELIGQVHNVGESAVLRSAA